MASITEAGWESRLEDGAPPDKRPRIESGYGGDKSVHEGGDDGGIPDYDDDSDDDFDDDSDDDSDDEANVPKELYEMYCKQLKESECFDVIDMGEHLWIGMVKRQNVDHDPTRKFATPFAEMAIKQFNEKENANFEFVRLVALTSRVVVGALLYITFEAKDACAQIKTFQAQVHRGIERDEVKFCRLKPPPTKEQGTEHEQVGQAPTCC
ncbi:ATP-dependent DNA helicase CHL1-like isoform X1 [Tripterygium wilfordii]|uniref:ATP-dependent DNA helicase CHL1-like isoform X1 n=1 Tax=Tripterygium wilfordii TaxID=458696 RepID=UPI0018F8386D|nr:ATP-dependent DNA helicase CHL1-like isoform X1 [Tripterygium wilfordii]